MPVPDLDEFLVKLDKVHDDAFFTLTDRQTSSAKPAAAAAPAPDSRGPSVVFVVAVLAGLGLAAWLARYFWKLNAPPGAAEPDAPQGLDGWMLLPSFQSIIGPPAMLVGGKEWLKSGSDAVFRNLPMSMQYLAFGIVLLITALLVLSVVQIILLFRRRNSFPRLFILMKVGYLAVTALSLALILDSTTASTGVERQIFTFVMSLFSSAIWIAYMTSSQRVRATFVKGPDTGEDYLRTRVPPLLGAEPGG